MTTLSDILNQRQVTWIKNNQTGEWFDFLRLNLDSQYFAGKRGIYVIWYTSPQQAKVIRLGQGYLGQRLKEHRANPKITNYSIYGQLKVSWILVDSIHLWEHDLNGVEKYLARVYSPTEGDLYPTTDPEVRVNLIG